MQKKVERKRSTNLKGGSFTSIAWVLELIDRTLVYGVFLLQVENGDRVEFSRKKQNNKRKGRGRYKTSEVWRKSTEWTEVGKARHETVMLTAMSNDKNGTSYHFIMKELIQLLF